jgi:histidine triad (HIT) family protein
MLTIFDKIISGDIPSYKVYEDDCCLAFLDIHPCVKGHTLVIPKISGATVFDLSDDMLQALMLATKKTMTRIQEVLHPDGFTVGWNHGEAGGQAISHVHVHILPRWYDDGGKGMHGIVNIPSDMPVADVAKLF